HLKSAQAIAMVNEWLEERKILRYHTKSIFNPYFGSIFRTFHNPSNFAQRLGQYSVLYTSSVTNLLNYSIDHVFYPRRKILPHEPLSFISGFTVPSFM
ncbi:5'-nucleotidase domain-containing protein 3, partial [Cichlidogyrus casuarinus]